jgi:plasmid maintenance system antidote protein VapI
MSNVTQIVTNYAVPTGDFIREWLEENEFSQADLARAMGVSAKHVSKLLAGASLSPDVALKLELVTGIPARIWLQQEATYRADVARLGLEESLASEKELAKEFPVSELRKLGVLSSTMRRPGVVLMELMAFFGVGSLEGLRTHAQPVPAFRQDQAHPVKPGSVQAWLRLIELELSPKIRFLRHMTKRNFAHCCRIFVPFRCPRLSTSVQNSWRCWQASECGFYMLRKCLAFVPMDALSGTKEIQSLP